MNRAGAIFRACLCFSLAPILSLNAHGAGLSVAEYRQQLQQFSSRIEQLKTHPEGVPKLEAEIPDHVSVTQNTSEYELSYEWLKTQLKQLQPADAKAVPALLSRIQERLHALDNEAQSYDQAQPDLQESRMKIAEILARHEFRKAHGPGFLEIWWAKLMRWLSNFFDRHPIYGRKGADLLHVAVYMAVALAFIVFALWIKRRLRRPKEDFSREIVPFAPSAKGWRTWLEEARASAQRERWRDGIHLAYWAGISFLEEQGAWRPDRARTPREYLRMLGTRKAHYPILSALTRKFEVIWYGHRDASAADFQETLGQLEKLGCR
jgi:hypothetical protein